MTILGLPDTSKTPSPFVIEPFDAIISRISFCGTLANLFVLATPSKKSLIFSAVSGSLMFDCKAAMYTSYEEFTSFTAKPVISILGLSFIFVLLVDKGVEVIGATLVVVMPTLDSSSGCNLIVYD